MMALFSGTDSRAAPNQSPLCQPSCGRVHPSQSFTIRARYLRRSPDRIACSRPPPSAAFQNRTGWPSPKRSGRRGVSRGTLCSRASNAPHSSGCANRKRPGSTSLATVSSFACTSSMASWKISRASTGTARRAWLRVGFRFRNHFISIFGKMLFNHGQYVQ